MLKAGPIEAADARAGLTGAAPQGGVIYTEGDPVSDQPMQLRDVSLLGHKRQFGTRRIYVHKEASCS